MSVFTLTLHEVLKHTSDIGLDDYPIFHHAHRGILNKKIINHYMYYEIGSETIEMFRFNMAVKMGEIMPLYNQYYESEQLKIDPFATMGYSEVVKALNTINQEETQTGSGTSTNTNESKSRAVTSETPQVMLGGSKDYASSASDSVASSEGEGVSTTNSEGNSSTENNIDSTREISGFTGAQANLLQAYRRTFLNIDLMIINELEVMFMGLWDNGESFIEEHSYGWMGW